MVVDRGDDKKPDTYGPPGSRHHVNQGLKQQQQQQQHNNHGAPRLFLVYGTNFDYLKVFDGLW